MLISEDYRELQKTLHENPDYGVASIEYAPIVTKIINQMGISELLDYGAGKGRLAEYIRPAHDVEIIYYDTAIEGWDDTPDSAQMVCCIDVLEHIEPECLEDVLDDLERCVEFIGVFSVHCGPAAKTLADGRNAHLIQERPAWWLEKLLERFDLVQYQARKNGFYVVVKPYGYQ